MRKSDSHAFLLRVEIVIVHSPRYHTCHTLPTHVLGRQWFAGSHFRGHFRIVEVVVRAGKGTGLCWHRGCSLALNSGIRVYLSNGRRARWCERFSTVTAESSDYGVNLRTV